MTWPELERWVAIAARQSGLGPEEVMARLANVRRVPPAAPTPGRTRFEGTPAPLADLDRPDAILALYGLVSVPKTWAYLEGAAALVGHIWRDAGSLAAWAAELPPVSWAAGMAVVASGLLGAPREDLAQEHPEATLLGAIVAGRTEVGHLARSGRLRDSLARQRLQAGWVLSALE